MSGWIKRQSRLLYGAYQRWRDDEAPLLAAAVAYYLGLSLFPSLLVLIAAVGMFLQFTSTGQSAERQILATVSAQFSPALEQDVAAALAQVKQQSAVGGPLGLLSVLVAALAGFAQFDRAFQQIWKVPRQEKVGLAASVRRLILQRGIAFLFLLGAGLLVVAVMTTGIALTAIRQTAHKLLLIPESLWAGLQIIVPGTLNVCVLAPIYRWLPRAPVRWSDAFRGAILGAVFWEIGRQLLAGFLIGSRYSGAYGVAGSVLAILLWCFYGVMIVFFAAEYIQELVSHRRRANVGGRPRAAESPPDAIHVNRLADAHR